MIPIESVAAQPERKPERRKRAGSVEKREIAEEDDMARSKWLMLAIASGTFAATNGLFAKLYVASSILLVPCSWEIMSPSNQYAED